MAISRTNGTKRTSNKGTESAESIGQSSSVGVYLAIVKDNSDPQNMGRLRVYVPAFGGNPEDETKWIMVSYASPFAGSTSIFEQGSNVKEYTDTIKSYGMWMVPPDLEVQVLVTFSAGRIDSGYWFACLYQTGTTGPVPGLPSGNTWTGPDKIRTNKNRKDKDQDLDKRVEHPLHRQLERQGLDKDTIRGLTSSGGERETPSKVLGILTPGQHSFVMDDGDKNGQNKLIRLRTSGGTQLLLDDTIGNIYAISKDGASWIELSVDGRISVYGGRDISLASEANVNIRASVDVNIEAGRDINLRAVNNLHGTVSNYNMTTSGNLRETVGGEASIKVAGQYIESAALIHMNGPVPSDAVTAPVNTLPINRSVTSSVCSTVPEHEPWLGHIGMINPKGPGNQQMKVDPAPQLVPRQPAPNETAAQVVKNPTELDQQRSIETSVEELTVSEQAVDLIRDENEFRGFPYEDDQGISMGFGSEIDTDSSIEDSIIENDQDPLFSEVDENLANGWDADRAEQKMREDISLASQQVKDKMQELGVKTMPPKVFDGLTSVMHQTGDITSAYIGKEKIDLREMYKNGEWDRAAGFIAADERDRTRRIKEANIMVNSDYGNPRTSEQVVAHGLSKSQELLKTGQLNQQTLAAASPSQVQALENSFLKITGKPLPSLSFDKKLDSLSRLSNPVVNKKWGY